jgi:hypothetical protein
MKEIRPGNITLESSFAELETDTDRLGKSFAELETRRAQMKGLYVDTLNKMENRIEEMKAPTALSKRLFERDLGRLVNSTRQEIQQLKGDIVQVEQKLTTIADDQQKLVELKNADAMPHQVLEHLRTLEAYYQNGHLSDTPADLENQRTYLQETYTRYIDIPRRLTDLNTNPHLTETDQALHTQLRDSYHENVDLAQPQRQALDDLYTRYRRPVEQLQALKEMVRLDQKDVQTLMRLGHAHERGPLNNADRTVLRDIHERYSSVRQKMQDLLDDMCALPMQHQRTVELLSRTAQERALTEQESQFIQYQHERYALPFKQLSELKKSDQVIERDRQKLAHIEAEYYQHVLRSDEHQQLSLLYAGYTSRYRTPREQLTELQASERVVYSDQDIIKQLATAFQQDHMTDGQRTKLQELHRAYIVPGQLLSELEQNAARLSEQDRKSIDQLAEAHRRGPLSGAEIQQLRDLHTYHATQTNQLRDLKQLSQLPLDDLNVLLQLQEASEVGPLDNNQRAQLTTLYEHATSEASPKVSTTEQIQKERGTIYQEYQQQIQQKKQQISLQGERLQSLEKRQSVNGSWIVSRKLYEFKTAEARRWLKAEARAIENKEHIEKSLPDTVRRVLQKPEVEKGLRELHKAEADVVRQWENVDLHVGRLTRSMLSLFDNEHTLEEAMKQRHINKSELRDMVKEYLKIKQNFARVLEQYQKAINSETLVNVHQNYHNTLNKHIIAPTKNIISNKHKIEDLDYTIAATKEYMDTLKNIAEARNSLVSKMTYLAGRAVENVGPGFSGGVGSAILKSSITPITKG